VGDVCVTEASRQPPADEQDADDLIPEDHRNSEDRDDLRALHLPGGCAIGSETAEQTQLFSNRNNAGIDDIRPELLVDEPDYSALAEELGPDAVETLRELVLEEEPTCVS
jgi:hypothetical protein